MPFNYSVPRPFPTNGGVPISDFCCPTYDSGPTVLDQFTFQSKGPQNECGGCISYAANPI